MVESTPACGSCGSCGRAEAPADLTDVHRVYLTPAAWSQGDDVTEEDEVVAEVEAWCASCRSTYPHQVVGAAEPEQ